MACMHIGHSTVVLDAMQSEGLSNPLARIEMPLVRVLAAMEHTRIAVDVEALALQKSVSSTP